MDMAIRILGIYLLAVNIMAFSMFGADKYKAERNLWRISEWQLLLSALAGGSLGAFLGMKLFRHKTRKPKFYIGVPVIVILQFLLMVWIVTTVYPEMR